MTPAAMVDARRQRLEELAADVEAHCDIQTALLPDDVSDDLISLSQTLGPRVMDTVSLARWRGLPILSDDLVYRAVAEALEGVQGLWLQSALVLCRNAGLVDEEEYVRFIAHLGRRQHGHTILDVPTMATAFQAGANDNLADFRALAGYVGIESMDVAAHISFTLKTWVAIWGIQRSNGHVAHQQAASVLLENLMRHGPGADWFSIASEIARRTQRSPLMSDFFLGWLRGHFLIDDRGRRTDAATVVRPTKAASAITGTVSQRSRRARRGRQSRRL